MLSRVLCVATATVLLCAVLTAAIRVPTHHRAESALTPVEPAFTEVQAEADVDVEGTVEAEVVDSLDEAVDADADADADTDADVEVDAAAALRARVAAQAAAGVQAVAAANAHRVESWWGLPASPHAMDRDGGYFGSQSDAATAELTAVPNFVVSADVIDAQRQFAATGTTAHDLDPHRFRELLEADAATEALAAAQAQVREQLELQASRKAVAAQHAFRSGVGATTAAVCAEIKKQIKLWYNSNGNAFGTLSDIKGKVKMADNTMTDAQIDAVFPESGQQLGRCVHAVGARHARSQCQTRHNAHYHWYTCRPFLFSLQSIVVVVSLCAARCVCVLMMADVAFGLEEEYNNLEFGRSGRCGCAHA